MPLVWLYTPFELWQQVSGHIYWDGKTDADISAGLGKRSLIRPITSPATLSSGPPLLPGLMGVSV
jgi:hypothetical protein